MKSRKYYSSEQAVIQEIDNVKAKRDYECKTAEVLDAEANALFNWINLNPKKARTDEYSEKHHRAVAAREEAAKLRKHQNAHVVRLIRLKNTLAVIRTEIMPLLPNATTPLQ